jgi:acyl transferase domain-containing protein
MKKARPSEIAIVGMGCRFAGAADLSEYFENILAARQKIREAPRDRWQAATFCDPDLPAPDRVPNCRGGYLDSPIAFDAAKYGIMPRTALGGEPEQFLVLDTAAAALADAGLSLDDLARRRVEVVIGRGNYFNRGNLTRLQHGRNIAQILSLLTSLFPEWSRSDREVFRDDLRAALPPFEAATIPGQLTNATAGRLADRLDLTGPAYVVDAASASSLVALDLAMGALSQKRADLAIAGGVYLEADVDFPLVFRQLNALSKSGTPRPFTADADGMVSGEGVGVVVLKRRVDAERDGDRIYALVQGVGLASDGRGRGLAAPSARGHARAIRRAYRRSGIDSSTVMLVEGHGLGVPAADRAEILALSATFSRPDHGRRYLGAASSMIGHAMPAAGMAGLIKAALALYHRVLPPTLHADRPHPLLESSQSPFTLNTSARPWIHADEHTPRRAAVNAFGFAGINAHAVLEEHAVSAADDAPGALLHWDTEAVLLAAPDRTALIERARELTDWLERNPRAELKDVAYSLNCLSEHTPGSARLGLVASSVTELADRLTALACGLRDPANHAIRDGRGAYYWDDPISAAAAPTLAFLFPGEGSQYPGMLTDLCIHFPEVRRLFDTADRIARELGETASPSEQVFSQVPEGHEHLWSTATAVNVVLNAQWALYQVLTRLGLRPDAVAGHSSGELLALAASGVFDTDRSLETKLGRLGAIFRGFECSGDLPLAHLIAVAASRDRVEALCRAAGAAGAAVAMDNCPHQVVLAVPPAEVEPLLGCLRQENVLWEDLPFKRAYHTEAFRCVLEPIREFFADLTFRKPSLPIYSCASRGRMPEDLDAIRELAIAQWTQTVAFRETIEAMHGDGLRLFVDVGARGNLAGFVEDILRGKPAFAMPANLPRRGGINQLNHLLAATFAQGAALKPGYLYARRRPRVIDWNETRRAPRTMVELPIGFPEMTLSDDVIRRLRSSLVSAVPREAADSVSCDQDPAADMRPVDDIEFVSRNDVATQGYSSLPTGAGLTSFDSRIAREDKPISAPPLDPIAGRWPAGISRADYDVVAAPEDADAMLFFQETMQAFLQTQHEIMAAYLGASIGEHSRAPMLPTEMREPGTDGHALWNGKEQKRDRSGSAVTVHDGNRVEVSLPVPPANEAAGFGRDEQTSIALGTLGAGRATAISGPTPGPWAGEPLRLIAAAEIDTVLLLDARNDPIAEHHTLGGRKVSAVDPAQRGLPVLPFAVMAEMAAQAAALVVTPGLLLTGLHQARAHKWIRYEEKPVHLELRGRQVPSAADERVSVGIYNRGTAGDAEAPRPVFEAIASFGDSPRAPQRAGQWSLENGRPSKLTAESVYAEQWLFHGPAFQAITGVGKVSEQGIEGTVRVLPLEALLSDHQPALFHTDLIVIDTFTQLLGCWGLEYLSEGDVVFPLSMEELQIEGDRPPVGTLVDCRITVKEIQRHRVLVHAEIVRPDGSVWMRICDWQDWRFHWPTRYRDVFRQPRDYFAGEDMSLDDPHGTKSLEAGAVWLEPPADMGRPVWRDVLEQTQLGPAERAAFLASPGTDRERTHRLWGRIAAKEAARRLWQAAGHPATYPADLAVSDPENDSPRLTQLGQASGPSVPAIALAHCDGVALALAASDPAARPGIEVSSIVDRDQTFVAAVFTSTERSLLDRWQGASRMEWIARLWCAKRAAARAMSAQTIMTANSEVVALDQDTGVVHVRFVTASGAAPADQVVTDLRVLSARRGGHAWAWTLGEGAAP